MANIPNDLKLARVVALYKMKSKTNVENYRPISMLNIIPKVFEKIVLNQLNDVLTEHKLLYEFQSGFRSSYSTDTCLIHLTDYTKQQCVNSNYIGIYCWICKKTCDTVDHAILLKKLKVVGVNELSICYSNVMIRFHGSLLISKCFTYQETLNIWSPYISAVSHSLLQRIEFHGLNFTDLHHMTQAGA